MIKTDGLTKEFDNFKAVDDLSITVEPGQLLALLGPNGAGKTTTVRMLSAIIRPTSGSASVNGYDVVTQPDRVRHSVGLLTEQPGLYSRSTGLEYLQFFGSLYGMDEADATRRSRDMLNRFGMGRVAEQRLGTYSKGMRQKIGLIRALLHSPAVLLLDEPTSAMDPHSAKLVRDAIAELRDDKRAVIFCTHNLVEAELLADKIVIISHGRLIAEGSPESLKRQLIGSRQFELKADNDLAGLEAELAVIVPFMSSNSHTIQYQSDQPRLTNPALVHFLSSRGVGVLSLEEKTATMEEVYLRIIEDDPN